MTGVQTCALPILASHSRRHRRSYGRTNRLIGLVVVTFALLWSPYHLSNALQLGAMWSGWSPGLLRFCQRWRPAVISLGYLSSAVNPLLYALAGPSPPRRPRPPGGRSSPQVSWMPLLRWTSPPEEPPQQGMMGVEGGGAGGGGRGASGVRG